MAGWVGEGGPYSTGHLVTATEFNELRHPWYIGDLTDVVNTAAFTDLLSVSIPGGTLGTNGVLRCTMGGDYLNDSAASRTLALAISFGGNFYVDASAAIAVSATRRAWKLEFNIANQSSAAVNNLFGHVTISAPTATVGLGDMGTPTPVVDSAIAGSGTTNTGSAVTFSVQAQHAVANASLSIRTYHSLVEIFPYS